MASYIEFAADTTIELYYAAAEFSGYGHKKITVELFYAGQYKKFWATTNNMPAFDAAMALDGEEKKMALYSIIEDAIADQVAEWIDDLNAE